MTDLAAGSVDVRVPCDRCQATGCDQCDRGVATETVTIRDLARTVAYLDAEERAELRDSAAAAPIDLSMEGEL